MALNLAGVPKNNAGALAVPGEDDERITDLANLDNITLEEAKKIIIALRKEGSREQDYQQRLKRKLNKLDESLASRREEVESTQRTLQLERGKEQSEKESGMRESGAKEKQQQENILKSLSEALYTKQTNSADSKPPREYVLDTVLVTYIRGKFRYPLNFRINDDTTVRTLRESACKYWGMKDPEQFVLKTMANNKCQDEVKVKECFKQGELAQLSLTKKMVENSAEPTEDEKKAIQPKQGKKKKGRDGGFDPNGADKQQNFSENYFTDLKKLGGVYFLLRARDQKPSDLASKIKLRDIVIYITLTIFTFWVYNQRRPPGYEYWFIKGIEDKTVAIPGMTDNYQPIPPFTNITQQDEVWDWLTHTLPPQLWSVTPDRVLGDVVTHGYPSKRDLTLNGQNLLLGYLNIRTQGVAPQACGNSATIDTTLGITCYPMSINEYTQEIAEMTSVSQYWNQSPLYSNDVRGTEASPGQWVSAETNLERYSIPDTQGVVQRYDASGYSVQYAFDVVNGLTSRQQMQEDMKELRRLSWITQQTRVVIVSFTLFNFHYDEWLACELMFEMPPSGGVHPSYAFRPFNVALAETDDEIGYWYVDCIRLMMATYIFIAVGYNERRHKIRNHKAGCWYHVSLGGICDIGIVSCLLCLVIWRQVDFEKGNWFTSRHMEQAQGTGPDVPVINGQRVEGFRSYAAKAYDFQTIYCIEGLVMLLLMLRMMAFTRLNHYVQIVKTTMGKSLESFTLLIAVFLPAMIGFTFVMYSVFGKSKKEFSLISRSLIQMYKLGTGDLSFLQFFDSDSVVAALLMLFWFCGVTFLLLSAFACVIVDMHYLVRLQTGAPEPWERKRWLTWAAPSLVVNIVSQVKQAIFADEME